MTKKIKKKCTTLLLLKCTTVDIEKKKLVAYLTRSTLSSKLSIEGFISIKIPSESFSSDDFEVTGGGSTAVAIFPLICSKTEAVICSCLKRLY